MTPLWFVGFAIGQGVAIFYGMTYAYECIRDFKHERDKEAVGELSPWSEEYK